ncbi:hypothetical protein AGMMS49975_05390 [Clostridia bacterium]|nr:hypothetical protein AGMMS49975_05390 [Clostridia bacterium]
MKKNKKRTMVGLVIFGLLSLLLAAKELADGILWEFAAHILCAIFFFGLALLNKHPKVIQSRQRENLKKMYLLAYMPFSVQGYECGELKKEYLPNNPERPQDDAMFAAVYEKRKTDWYAGAKLAGQEIYLNLTEWFKDAENRVHAESLLAAIGALGGAECLNGTLEAARAADLGKGADLVFVDTVGGEKFVVGDLLSANFFSFYDTAADDSNAHDALIPLIREVTSKFGDENYWDTPFYEYVKKTPREITEVFGKDKFSYTFKVYCLFPYERLFAYGIAAQKAVAAATAIMPKERALQIIAEYGWRTKSYLSDK